MKENEIINIIRKFKTQGWEILDLFDKGLTSLPSEIDTLCNLKILHLSRNLIESLPESIAKLQDLTELYLFGNKLQSLPQSIGGLRHLVRLSIYDNELVELPNSIGNLSCLRQLFAKGNLLESIPSTVGNLENLDTLDLSDNRLKSLPGSIGRLKNLKRLYLRGNPLRRLPEEVAYLPKLEILDTDAKVPETVPPEVAKKGWVATVNYFRNLERGKLKRYEAKLILVGQGNTGKTCLSRALRDLEFKTQPTTHGVEIKQWTVPHPYEPNEDITLRVWDFEGQEITHSTHQFFLTERSLYLLVFNGRAGAEAGKLPYWLETIRARAPGCEVVLVATECEDRNPPLDYELLKSKFGNQLRSEDFFRVSALTGKNIDILKGYIAQRAAELELMGHDWPKSYANVEMAIRQMADEEKGHISRRELFYIMAREGIENEQHESLSRILGDLGTITHFPDSPVLGDFIVLNPQWLTGAISRVLEHEPLEKSGGYLENSWLTELWSEDYPGMVNTFHRGMEEFQICYPLAGDIGRSLVPLRFKPIKPAIQWEENLEAVSRLIRYRFTFMPAGVMARFIVNTHLMSTGVFWQNGVFLRWGRSQALCELKPNGPTIDIEVRSAYPQSFMEQLCGYLETILNGFEGLRYEKLFVCIGGPKGNTCGGEFPYEQVIDALIAAHIGTIRCYKGSHDVDPLELVYGFTSFQRILEKRQLEAEPNQAEILHEILDSLRNLKEELTYGLNEKTNQIIEQLQREFIKQMEFLEVALFKKCPTLVSITPAGKSHLHREDWFGQKYNLRLYCQAEEGIHPVGKEYTFTETREWWLSVRSYTQRVLRILNLVAGPAVGVLPVYLSRQDWETMKNEAELMKEVVKMANILVGRESGLVESEKWSAQGVREIDGSDLRSLAYLLEKIDPAHGWRGLQLIYIRGENKYLWLCKEHAKKYIRGTAKY